MRELEEISINGLEGLPFELISEDDLAYFKAVAAQKAATDAVWQHWAAYLSTKYKLGPQDQVDSENGVISRG